MLAERQTIFKTTLLFILFIGLSAFSAEKSKKSKPIDRTKIPVPRLPEEKRSSYEKAAKEQAPKAAPASDITYEQLCLAKAMAKQLGGAEKAKEALAALSQLLG